MSYASLKIEGFAEYESEEEDMNQQTRVCIAYIACRLISGKRITSLYDIGGARKIDVKSILEADFIRDFDERHRNYVPGFASECRYEYTSDTGHDMDIFINWKTFILHIKGSAAYFIGNVRGDTIYLYDHKGSAHFRYRITSCAEERAKTRE